MNGEDDDITSADNRLRKGVEQEGKLIQTQTLVVSINTQDGVGRTEANTEKILLDMKELNGTVDLDPSHKYAQANVFRMESTNDKKHTNG